MSRLMTLMLASAIGAAAAGTASAQNVSRDVYRAEKDRIEQSYKQAKDRCDGLAGNAKDVCQVQAQGNEKVAKADLDARRDGTAKARSEARMARIEADYELAKERCDDLAGNAKDVCLKEAKAAEARATGDAKVARTRDEARNDEAARSGDARRNANEATRDAEYDVARERCETMAGDAKDRCVADARTRFGRS